MLIDYRHKLVFIATTKTGTTSIEETLCHVDDVGYLGFDHRLRHKSFSDFNKMKKSLEISDFFCWSVIRHPVEKFFSWYKFRRLNIFEDRGEWYTGNKTIKDHIENLTDDDIFHCDDRNMIFDNHLKCNIIFKYEKFHEVTNFVNSLYPTIKTLPIFNSSPKINNDFSNEKLIIEEILKEQIDWYQSFTPHSCKDALNTLINRV